MAQGRAGTYRKQPAGYRAFIPAQLPPDAPIQLEGGLQARLSTANLEWPPGGPKPEPDLDRLSNLLKTFNDQFGNIAWSDADRAHKLITEDIPARVAADTAFQEREEELRQAERPHRARQGVGRVMTAVLKDDTELFKQFMDNESFKRWLTDTVFGLTYEPPVAVGPTAGR